MHFIYLSFVTLTGHGMFKPHSVYGRFYAIVKAFVLLILWSCYSAALTAHFDEPELAQQPIAQARLDPVMPQCGFDAAPAFSALTEQQLVASQNNVLI